MKKHLDVLIGTIASLALLGASWLEIVPFSLTEALGFVTGAACVWLTVKQNIWNWPLGLANNVFFIVLFLGAGLYGDMSLQLVYIVLGILGWYWWLHGGENRSQLRVARATPTTLLIMGALILAGTLGLTLLLQIFNGSAPFLDALTTVLSLAAQYLLTRKLIENWYVWITADVLYVGLYAAKGLYLTSGLYAIFLGMCVVGLWSWQKSLTRPVIASTLATQAEVVHG